MLSWTPDMKKKAKEEELVLVKFQAQYKHCGGPNIECSGPFSIEKAEAMQRITYLRNNDPKLARINAILEEK